MLVSTIAKRKQKLTYPIQIYIILNHSQSNQKEQYPGSYTIHKTNIFFFTYACDFTAVEFWYLWAT